MKINIPYVVCFLLVILMTAFPVLSDDAIDEDLSRLQGKWIGVGEAAIPVTGISVSIEGEALFSYIAENNYLKTEITGRKLFFSYSDSGHLSLSVANESISWEIWDSFGKYSHYKGAIEAEEKGAKGGKTLKVTNRRGDNLNKITVRFITPDSLTFMLETIYSDGKSKKNVTLDLRRVKD